MKSVFPAIRMASFSIRSKVSQSPRLFSLYYPYICWGQIKRRFRGSNLKEGILHPFTELVIDGFQGSANSYATTAFKYFQIRDVNLFHHRHAPVMIIQAIEREIPVVLTIREPLGTILSLTSRWPHVSVVQALNSYIGFYKCLLPYSHGFIVSDFPNTVNGLDKVISTLNDKFGTDFETIDVELANLKCRDMVSDSSKVAQQRKKLKILKQKDLYASPKAINLLKEAEKIHRQYQELEQFEYMS